ncbi:MAG: peptide chain release factor-like protein [Pirellulaceae bacterium]|nr:peptide chain release factor-like protein [Pirellulaceae bacterium]
MAIVHPVTLSDDELLRQCDMQLTRRGGPGGQHRNKVETTVVLTHRETKLRAEAAERRSQSENRQVALFRLRLLLALTYRTPKAASPKPSVLWQSRLVGSRIAVNPGHGDFPVLLAEVLDQVEHARADLKEVASFFACSSSQLVKFLKLEPRALRSVNEQRLRQGLRPLK